MLVTYKNTTKIKHASRGFTIVELLIVIVVIGILAAITIVAYNGTQSRGRFAKMQTDIKTMQRYIESYNATNGSYPNTSLVWQYQRQSGTNTFIPGIVPGIANSLPSITDGPAIPTNNTYIYISNGTDYKLDRLYQNSIPADEWAQVPQSMKDGSYTDRWGVWSSGGTGF